MQTLGISERTLFRRHEELNLPETFSNITDTQLKDTIGSILQQTPYVGEKISCQDIGYENVYVHLILLEEQ